MASHSTGPARLRLHSERVAEALADEAAARLGVERIGVVAPIAIGGHSFGVVRYSAESISPRLLRLGPLVFVEVPGGIFDEHSIERWELRRRVREVKLALGVLHEEHRGNIVFTRPSKFSTPALPTLWFQVSPFTLLAAACMLSEAARFQGYGVVDLGAGDGLLTSIALGLGARRAVLVENDPVEVEKARAFLGGEGRVEAGEAGAGDHCFFRDDISEERFVERLCRHPVAREAGIVIANIGPWYGDLDVRAAEIAAGLAASRLVFLGGFRSRDEGHVPSLRAARESLERRAFRTRLVEHAFLPEGYQREETAGEGNGPFRIEPSWNTVGVVIGCRSITSMARLACSPPGAARSRTKRLLRMGVSGFRSS